MRPGLLLFFCLIISALSLNAQFTQSARDAFVITRMAQKFHVEPRPVNDEFSADVFTLLIKDLDEHKIYFTQTDIKTLAQSRLLIDDDIKTSQTGFLKKLSQIYIKRLQQADSAIINTCKTPFNFNLPERLTIQEDTAYPADEKAIRGKLNKLMKYSAIDVLEEDYFDIASAQRKKYLDSAEPKLRLRIQKTYRRPIQLVLHNIGGPEAYIGTAYCKAVAEAFDPHTEYFPLTEKENFESELGQKAMIFGFALDENDDGAVVITNVLPGSPAFKSGQIHKGDIIESVQWKNEVPMMVTGEGLRRMFDILNMSNHDEATFNILKPDGSHKSIVLIKAKNENDEGEEKVKSFVLKGDKTIGFLSLPAFYEDWENENGINGCANDVAKEVLKLKKENIEGLILDFRYNGGGSVAEAVALTGIFIDAGPVAQVRSSERTYTLKDMNRGTIYDGPLILLVNEYSASASEFVAGALQDHNRAIIAGSPTYGKATMQTILPLDTTVSATSEYSKNNTSSFLKITESYIYRVTGKTVQAHGVTPDIDIPDPAGLSPVHEADNFNYLRAADISPCKYFTPGKPLPVNELRAQSKSITDTSLYFKFIKNYIAENNHSKQQDISLRLADHEDQSINIDSLKNKISAPYSVYSSSFNGNQINMSEEQKIFTQQWKEFLLKDPEIYLVYKLMQTLINKTSP